MFIQQFQHLVVPNYAVYMIIICIILKLIKSRGLPRMVEHVGVACLMNCNYRIMF